MKTSLVAAATVLLFVTVVGTAYAQEHLSLPAPRHLTEMPLPPAVDHPHKQDVKTKKGAALKQGKKAKKGGIKAKKKMKKQIVETKAKAKAKQKVSSKGKKAKARH